MSQCHPSIARDVCDGAGRRGEGGGGQATSMPHNTHSDGVGKSQVDADSHNDGRRPLALQLLRKSYTGLGSQLFKARLHRKYVVVVFGPALRRNCKCYTIDKDSSRCWEKMFANDQREAQGCRFAPLKLCLFLHGRLDCHSRPTSAGSKSKATCMFCLANRFCKPSCRLIS